MDRAAAGAFAASGRCYFGKSGEPMRAEAQPNALPNIDLVTAAAQGSLKSPSMTVVVACGRAISTSRRACWRRVSVNPCNQSEMAAGCRDLGLNGAPRLALGGRAHRSEGSPGIDLLQRDYVGVISGDRLRHPRQIETATVPMPL